MINKVYLLKGVDACFEEAIHKIYVPQELAEKALKTAEAYDATKPKWNVYGSVPWTEFAKKYRLWLANHPLSNGASVKDYCRKYTIEEFEVSNED